MNGKEHTSYFAAVLLAVAFLLPSVSAGEHDSASSDDFYNLDAVDRTETKPEELQPTKEDQPTIVFEIPTRPLPDPNDQSRPTDGLRELEELGKSTISGSGAKSQMPPPSRAAPTTKVDENDRNLWILVGLGIAMCVALGKLLLFSRDAQRGTANRVLPEKLHFPDPDSVDGTE